jgi:hypothetical protein
LPKLKGLAPVALLSLLLPLTASALAAQDKNPKVTQIASRGSAIALAGPGAVPGSDLPPFRDSNLPLSWMMIVDSSLGVVPDELAGGRPDVKAGLYALKLGVKLRAFKDVVGVELSFVTFNIWNRFTGVFRASEVVDIKRSQTRGMKLFWYGMDKADLNVYQTSILYISRVRLSDGTVIVADRSLVLDMAKRIETNFTDQDLDKTKASGKDAAEAES